MLEAFLDEYAAKICGHYAVLKVGYETTLPGSAAAALLNSFCRRIETTFFPAVRLSGYGYGRQGTAFIKAPLRAADRFGRY